MPRATVPGMVNVVIEPYDDGSNTVTRATCLAGPGHERPPAGELARIGATFTRSKSVMQLTWAEIEKDPRHLQRGVELLRDLTRPPETGAFR